MSSRSSSHASSNRNDEPLLPFGHESIKHGFGYGFEKKPSLKYRVRSIFSRGLVKRLMIWTVVSLVLASIALYSTKRVSHYDVATHHTYPGHSESTGYGKKKPHKAKGKDGGALGDSSQNPGVVVPVEDDDTDNKVSLTAEELEAKKQYQDDVKRMPWLKFKQ